VLVTDDEGMLTLSRSTVAAQLTAANADLFVMRLGTTPTLNPSPVTGLARVSEYRATAPEGAGFDAYVQDVGMFLANLYDDGTDTDTDGLTDCEETNGLLITGTVQRPAPFALERDHVAFTDPGDSTSDTDQRVDGDELVRKRFSTNPTAAAAYITLVARGQDTYFVPRTGYPDRADTDGDGLNDFGVGTPPTGRNEPCPGKGGYLDPLRYSSNGSNVSDGVFCAVATAPMPSAREITPDSLAANFGGLVDAGSALLGRSGTVGLCGNASLALRLLAFSGSLGPASCLVDDRSSVGIMYTFEAGQGGALGTTLGALTFSVGTGAIVSNANQSDQLLGFSLCAASSTPAPWRLSANAESCYSLNTDVLIKGGLRLNQLLAYGTTSRSFPDYWITTNASGDHVWSVYAGVSRTIISLGSDPVSFTWSLSVTQNIVGRTYGGSDACRRTASADMRLKMGFITVVPSGTVDALTCLAQLVGTTAKQLA
jgi:hypothetical protein